MDWLSEASEEVSAVVTQLYALPLSDVKHHHKFIALGNSDIRINTVTLASIPTHSVDPFRPLHILYLIITELPGPWPPSSLLYHLTRLQATLTSGASLRGNDRISKLLKSTDNAVKQLYGSIVPFVQSHDRPALRSPCGDMVITYAQLTRLLANFVLPCKKDSKKPVVAIILPDGPLLAAISLAVATYYVAFPSPPGQCLDRLQIDLHLAGVNCIITNPEEKKRFSSIDQWLSKSGIALFTAEVDQDIRLRDKQGRISDSTYILPSPQNKPDDVALILFNNEPWGNRDLAEISIHDMVKEAYLDAELWSLSTQDLGVNMVSIHDTGLNKILTSLVSGSSVVCCSADDITGFWHALGGVSPSWYLASEPTHKRILADAPFHRDVIDENRLRLACGSEGYVSPQLSDMIYDVFGCDIVTKSNVPNNVTIPLAEASTSSHGVAVLRRSSTNATTTPNLFRSKSVSGQTSNKSVSRRSSHRGAENLVVPGRRPSTRRSYQLDESARTRPESYIGLEEDDFFASIGSPSHKIICDETTISAEEVEEAIMEANSSESSPMYRHIAQALVFPTAHEILGQDVAVILVPSPGTPRVGLRILHIALLEQRLDPVKWPMVIIYMDSIPQRNGKPLRTRLQHRFHLPSISSGTTYLSRHWEATCASSDESFMKEIKVRKCKVDQESLMAIINSVIPNTFTVHLLEDSHNGGYEAFVAPEASFESVSSMREDWEEYIRRLMLLSAHGYIVPENIYVLSVAFLRDHRGVVDVVRLQKIKDDIRNQFESNPEQSTNRQVKEAFASVLSKEVHTIFNGSNFFQLGGNRSQADDVLNILRTECNIDMPYVAMAKNATVDAISKAIEQGFTKKADEVAEDIDDVEMYSSTRWWLLVLQLLPLVILYPARRSAQWTVQLWLLSRTRFWGDNITLAGRLFNLVLSIIGAWAWVTFLFPLIGIISKWIIIGRYKEGLYPMWGPYHTRWWMVQKITSLCGMGFFEVNDYGKRLYYRFMGAKIGKGVKINDVDLGEWDLLDIGEGVTLTKCHCRPFAAERNSSMYLRRIVIGARSSVGVFSFIAPGTEILPNSSLGANSSSWEQRDSIHLDDSVGPKIQGPHWALSILLTWPIYWLVWSISLTPWLGAQIPVLYKKPGKSNTPLRVILDWFQGNPGVAFHYVAVMARVLLTPVIFLGFAVSFRFLCVLFWGDLPTDSSEINGHFMSWRSTLMKTLYPESQLNEMNELLGQNHGARSGLLRLLGAKVGKRACWPNEGPSISDYHLLTVGDDVTFGSNSQLLSTDEHSSGMITIQDEAVVADHACLLPGVNVGERTTIAYGTLTKRGKHYPNDKTFVGCRDGDIAHSDSFAYRLWEGQSEPGTPDDDKWPSTNIEERKDSDATLVGDIEMVSRMEQGYVGAKQNKAKSKGSARQPGRKGSQHDRPFYRAYYLKQAPYHLLSPLTTLAFSMFMTVFTEFYWNVPAMSSMKLAARIFVERFKQLDSTYDPVVLYLLNFVSTVALTTTFALMAFGAVMLAKRILIGKFKSGVYDWDKSPYCQRWQMFVALSKLIRHCYIDKGGIVSLLTGTHWLVLYYRALGSKIGKDCSLFASGSPSLMLTETDLIEIGDRVVVDNAAIVSHIDRRGSIQLEKIKIGNRCVLRSGSNILSGSEMKDDSFLMEHTLILPGEVVEKGWVMHRRPAERFLGNRRGTVHSTK